MKRARKSVYIGVFTALALIFSYVEYLVPIPVPVPGFKLGLSNLVILVILLVFGFYEALFVGLIKVSVSALLFGNLFSFCFSFSGFLLSFFVMVLLLKSGKISVPVVSLAGGVFHNFAQLVVASLLLKGSFAVWILPVLSLLGMGTGLIVGFLALFIFERIKKNDWFSSRDSL